MVSQGKLPLHTRKGVGYIGVSTKAKLGGIFVYCRRHGPCYINKVLLNIGYSMSVKLYTFYSPFSKSNSDLPSGLLL